MGLADSLKHHFRPASLAGLPPIETARLRIGALAPGDAHAVQVITNDPAVTGAIDFLPDRFGLDDAGALIASARNGRDVFLGARERGSTILVGVIGTHLRRQKAIELGYWIGGASRGRGLGGEAVGAVVAALALQFPRRLIIAECRGENTASAGLLLKLGFRDTGEEGHRPGRTVFVWKRG